jgi:NO-binding membrane sensor protein with MHYT domain/two-component sensor histidine kinase
MNGTYDGWLVLLSAVVSITASFVALDLASHVAASNPRKAEKSGWRAAGALSMGTGIWSMHFIGMLAWQLPIPMSFDILTTLLSLAIAVAAAWIALNTVGRDVLGTPRLLVGGLLMGAGIAAMHYTGMSAMKMQPPIRYDPWLFTLSIAIAIVASMLALRIAYELRMETLFTAFRKKAGSAILMGGAICGMHYTGLAAAIVASNSICAVYPTQNIDNQIMGMVLGSLTMLFLVATMLISAFAAYRASLAELLALQTGQQLAAATGELEGLSRNLHDNIVQAVYAIGMRLEECQRLVRDKPEQVSARLAQVIDDLNNVIREVRRYIAGSQRQVQSALQFRAELFQRVAAFQLSKAPRLQIEVDDAAVEQLTRDDVEQVLSIAREALSNCLQHSHAQHGTVALRIADGGVRLEIADDGVGFDPGRHTQDGGGLRNMQARASQIGAELEVMSSPEGGTRIFMHIPGREKIDDAG